jgi:hypothetical protein
MVSVTYTVQDALVGGTATSGTRSQSSVHALIRHGSGFTPEDSDIDSPPGKPADPFVAPAPTLPSPPAPRLKDFKEDGDTFFDAKFRKL